MTSRDHGLRAKRFALLFGLWLVLTGARPDGLAFGLAAAAGATALVDRLAPPDRFRLLRLIALAPGFFRRSLAGGFDVAWRAFHPRLPIRPGWITYRSRLPAGAARVLLSGEVTMMPGSLIAGSEADHLLIHCLDTTMPVAATIREEERRLERAVVR